MLSLHKTKWGFYQYRPLPSEQSLEEYYRKKYYQEGLGRYSLSYNEEEITWRRNRAELIAMPLQRISSQSSFLDVGCGEGWLMDAMYRKGYAVRGVDFSRVAIAKWHPHLLPYFSQGNIYTQLEEQKKTKERYRIVFIGNVIEHVLDPERMLQTIREMLTPDSVLVVIAPNDFSDMQKHILDSGVTENPWWLAYPEHISYFNSESMRFFLEDMGFHVWEIAGDFPIEYNLFSSLTNYINNQSVGSEAHKIRMRVDNYLFGISPQKTFEIYTLLGNMGIGRNLIYYAKLRN